MRINLAESSRRRLMTRLAIHCVSRYIGLAPGPMLFMSYDPKQIPASLVSFMMRSTGRRGAFSKGERELFAAFVSRLNSCHF